VEPEAPLLTEDSVWAEETASRVGAAWKLSPPLPPISGDDFVRALLHCGWFVQEQGEVECRLTREGREVAVPRHAALDFAIVAALSMAAGLGPLMLIAALERGILPGVDSIAGRP
jgi:hypothetical protein